MSLLLFVMGLFHPHRRLEAKLLLPLIIGLGLLHPRLKEEELLATHHFTASPVYLPWRDGPRDVVTGKEAFQNLEVLEDPIKTTVKLEEEASGYFSSQFPRRYAVPESSNSKSRLSSEMDEARVAPLKVKMSVPILKTWPIGTDFPSRANLDDR
ncbi:uncharacterized protein LOC125233112 [Leguminivora glycinivorella]|uniref:uncharacterized protein LOC125233112 n=1 Tax=Leguminivora glycinivorella TaxID=1035111 RepID=UPI00200EA15F|nr:uncharacterized protein LOC125233112 [Leguminivora glycinivorella]